MNLGGYSGHFVPQAEVKRKVGTPPPIILYIGAKNILAEIPGSQGTRNASLKFSRLILEEFRQIIEKPDSIWIRQGSRLQQHTFKRCSELNGMGAFSKKGVIIALIGIPMVEVGGESADAAGHVCKAATFYVPCVTPCKRS